MPPVSLAMTQSPETSVTFLLEGAGWATLTLAVGPTAYSLDGVSYCTNALCDLVTTARSVLNGHEASCFFDGEPTEWVLSARPDGAPGWIELCLTEDAEEKLAARCEARAFAAAVAREAARLLQDHGTAGYEELWTMHPFPERELQLLQQALAQ